MPFLIPYIKKLSLLSLLLLIAAVLFRFLAPEAFVTPALPFLVPFFFSVSLFSQGFLARYESGRFAVFARTFMAVTFVKFILYLMVVVAWALLQPAAAVPFILSFFILFLVYLVFDMMYLLKKGKEDKNKTEDKAGQA